MLTLGSDVFAVFNGVLPGPTAVDTISMNFRARDFGGPGERVTVGFELVRSSSDEVFAPGPLSLAILGSGGATILERDPHAENGAASVLIADVRPGTYSLDVTSTGGLYGSYTLNVYLVGDTNGNGQVTATDVAATERRLGKSATAPGVPPSADANRDGVISPLDVQLATHDLGGWTRVTPLSVTAHLASVSDPDGNGIVTRPDIRVVGQTTPGSRVQVSVLGSPAPGQVVAAAANGSFAIDTTVGLGTTPVLVIATDPFGQTTRTVLNVVRSDEVVNWNALALRLIQQRSLAAPAAARVLAVMSASVYDSVVAIEGAGQAYRVVRTAPAGASEPAAVIAAAREVLQTYFPADAGRLDLWYAGALAALPPGITRNRGVRLGQSVADAMLRWRLGDGAGAHVKYKPSSALGKWQPTAPAYQSALLPQWKNVTPFALTSPSEYLAPAPPALTSADYATSYNDVKALGVRNSTSRTADQTAAALFWNEPQGTVTPVGLWNQIAQSILIAQNATIAQDARTFALLNLAEADAGIAAFKAKYTYNTWRPATAIHAAASDVNPATSPDPAWQPLLAEQPTPSYVSDSSAYAGAAQIVLQSVFGANVAFTATSDGAGGLSRSFTSFAQAADEAGRSQVYAGTAFEFDNERGLNLGQAIGRLLVQVLS
jgi:hypothetical protein